MSASRRRVTLKEISLVAGSKWREVKIDINEDWNYIFKDPIENQPVGRDYEEGEVFVLRIRTRKWILFWHQVAELEVTEDIISEARARPDNAYAFPVDGHLATLVLQFEESRSNDEETSAAPTIDELKEDSNATSHPAEVRNISELDHHSKGQSKSASFTVTPNEPPLAFASFSGGINQAKDRNMTGVKNADDSNPIEENVAIENKDWGSGTPVVRDARKDSGYGESLFVASKGAALPRRPDIAGHRRSTDATIVEESTDGEPMSLNKRSSRANFFEQERCERSERISASQATKKRDGPSQTVSIPVLDPDRQELPPLSLSPNSDLSQLSPYPETPPDTTMPGSLLSAPIIAETEAVAVLSFEHVASGAKINIDELANAEVAHDKDLPGAWFETTSVEVEPTSASEEADAQALSVGRDGSEKTIQQRSTNPKTLTNTTDNISGMQEEGILDALAQHGDSPIVQETAGQLNSTTGLANTFVLLDHPDRHGEGEVASISSSQASTQNFPALLANILRIHPTGEDGRVMRWPSRRSHRGSGTQLGDHGHGVAHSELLEEDVTLATLNAAREMTEQKDVPIARLGIVHSYLKSFLAFGVALSELDPVAKAIMASVVEIHKIFESQKKVQDEMIELLEVMSRALPLLIAVDKFDSVERLKEAMQNIKRIMAKTVRFASRWAKMSRLHAILRAISDKDKTKIDGLKKDFETFIAEYGRGVSVETLLQVQDIGQSLQSLVSRTQEQQDVKTLEQVRDAYAHATVAGGDADGCVPETRENVIKEIMDWSVASDRQNVLWLRSMPGAGKSTVARTVVRQLIDAKRHGANFFFSRDDVGNRTPFVLWCHILYSLSCQIPTFRNLAAAHMRETRFEIGSSHAEDVLNIVLHTVSMLAKYDIAPGQLPVIVIDALDECPKYSLSVAAPRQSVLEAIKRWSNLPSLFKIVVTSREDSDISKVLGDPKTAHSIHLRTGHDVDEQTSRDISCFLKKRLPRMVNPSTRDLDKLSQRAAGLFVWASTAIQFILGQGGLPTDRFRRILHDELPGRFSDELSKLYHVILTEEFTTEPDETVQIAFERVIGTLIISSTPLSQMAIIGLLIGPQGEYSLEREAMENVLERIQMLTNAHTSLQAIRFAHQSFPEFLLHSNPRDHFYGIDQRRAESYLATRCLVTMNATLRSNLCPLPQDPQHMEECRCITPSLRYAVQYWSTHICNGPPDTVLALVQLFYDQHLLNWLEVMSTLGCMSRAIEMLRKIASWLQMATDSTPTQFIQFANDAVLFATYFAECIRGAAPHVYTSALAFAPTTSSIAQHYTKLSTTCTPVVSLGRLSHWPKQSQEAEDYSPWVAVPLHGYRREGKPTLKRSLPGEKNYVFCAAFTPDGKHVVTGSGDKIVRVWNLATGLEVKGPFGGHTERITSIAVSTDGRYLASGSNDQTILVRRLDTGELVGEPLRGHTAFVMSIAFSPDGTRIVSGSVDKTIRIWDVASGKLVVDPLNEHTKTVASVAISRDGKLIASGSNDNSICIWSLETGKLRRRLDGHTKVILSVAFSPDGSQVVSGSEDKTARVWKTDTGETLRIYKKHSGVVTSVAFSSNGAEIVSGSSDKSVRIWSILEGMSVERVLRGHTGVVYTVACSQDGRHIATGSRDQTMRLWNVKNHCDRVTVVAYSTDGMHVASGSRDGTVRIRSVKATETAQYLIMDHVVGVTSLAFSDDASHIVSGYADESVRVWNAHTGDLVAMRAPHREPLRAISSVAFSSDHKSVISSTVDHRVHFWAINPVDAKDKHIQISNTLGTSPLMTLSPRKKWTAAVSSDYRTLQLYDIDTGDAIQGALKGHSDRITCLAFSEDGNYVVSGSEDNSVRIWDAEQAQLEQVLFGEQPVTSVAFSPDGKRIASGSAEGQISIWDIDSGEMVYMLEGHLQPVRSVAFSRDGEHLVSGSDDQSVRVWSLSNLDDSVNDAWTLSRDGWVTGNSGKTLCYVPPIHRPNLYRPRNTAVFGEDVTQIILPE